MYEEKLKLLRELIQLLQDDEDNKFVINTSIHNLITAQTDPLAIHAILEELLIHHDKSRELPRIMLSALVYLFRNESYDRTFSVEWSDELMAYSRKNIYYIVGGILHQYIGSLYKVINDKMVEEVCSYFSVTSIDEFILPKRANTYYDLRNGYALLLTSMYGDDVIDFIVENMGRAPLNFKTTSGGFESVEEMKSYFNEDFIETFEFVYDTITLRTS